MKIKFTNVEGKTVELDENLTIEQAVKLHGIREIKLVPKNKPLPKDKRWFTHTPTSTSPHATK